jgi:hypothetical protein
LRAHRKRSKRLQTVSFSFFAENAASTQVSYWK